MYRYIIAMKEIAAGAHVSESELIDIVVEGIRDQSNRRFFLLAPKTMSELKQLIVRYECVRPRTLAAAISKMPAARASTTAAQSTIVSPSPSTGTMTTASVPEASVARAKGTIK